MMKERAKQRSEETVEGHKLAYLVTGGCGFVGSNLAAELIRRGDSVVVFDNLSRHCSTLNLEWLRELGAFEFVQADVRNIQALETLFTSIDIECVFHLAGQVAMTASLENPWNDFEVNVLGTINILESVRRHAPTATVVYASSNKVYGDLSEDGLMERDTRYEPLGKKDINELARLDFRTPYGCSKGAADQYVQDYARTYGLKTVVFRHSTIYGERQRSTFDQGWVGWFCQKAIDTIERPDTIVTVNGDGKQVRDLLHVSDAVACYLVAHERISKMGGAVMNIGGGYDNSLSLRELFLHLEEHLGIHINVRELPWRSSDQRYFVSDNSRATELLGWAPRVTKHEGISDVVTWEKARRSLTA